MKGRAFATVALALILASAAEAAGDDLERALSLAVEERYAEARELLDPFLEGNPGHPRARLLHGMLNARTGKVSEAIDIFRALLEDHPDMFEPYNNLAVLYAVQGRLDESRETLLAALEHQPAAVVYANLGDVYSDLARRAYLRARSFEGGGESSPEGPAVVSATATGMEREGQGQDFASGDSDGVPSEESRSGQVRPGVCARTRGFEDLEAVSGAVAWLRARGTEIVALRLEEDRSIKSYRVFLPSLESHEKAAEIVREIQGRGVSDVAIIGDGALKNGVSFGVYRDEENMRRRIAALEALGYPAQSAPDIEIVDDYVIEVHAPTAFDADWNSSFPDYSIRTVDCDRFREP